jgi:hypothetical protein
MKKISGFSILLVLNLVKGAKSKKVIDATVRALRVKRSLADDTESALFFLYRRKA